MKQALSQFLKGDSTIQYKPFKARIVQVEPFRISEDLKEYLELPLFLTPEEAEKARKSPSTSGEVQVEDWQFEAVSNPNTQGSLVTIVPRKYKLSKPSTKAKVKAGCSSLLENDEIRPLAAAYVLKSAVKTEEEMHTQPKQNAKNGGVELMQNELLDLGDMMTASGRKDEPIRGKVLDFTHVKIEDLSTRKNLRTNFDLIFTEEMEKEDVRKRRFSSLSQETRCSEDSVERHKDGTDRMARHKLQQRDC